MTRLQAAEQFRAALQKFAMTLGEDAAIEVAAVFPAYAVGKSYALGDYFTHGENGVGDPQLYLVLQAHTSAQEWLPESTASLYKPVGVTAWGCPEWSQPVGTSDAYNIGDIVSYNGTLYRCIINANVWSPEAYPAGWEVYNG